MSSCDNIAIAGMILSVTIIAITGYVILRTIEALIRWMI